MLPVVHGGQAAVARAQDPSGAALALRVQAVTTDEEQARQMERLMSMLTVVTAAREDPDVYPSVLPVRESFIMTVPGSQIPLTGAAPEYELWCDVMPWCPDDLNDWKRVAGKHPAPQAVLSAFLPVMATVQAVHQHLGIIHRDITPNNVLVDSSGRLLLADWGIAHGLAENQTSTHTQLIGNRAFALPPEMVAGDPSVGRYTDAWYLGCLLSWMLTGQTPGPQHAPAWLPPDLGSPTDVVPTVVAGLCAPDPRQRLALPDATAALLEDRPLPPPPPTAATEPIAAFATTPLTASVPSTHPTDTAPAPVPQTAAAPKKPRLLLWAGATVLIVVCAVFVTAAAVYALTQQSHDATPPPVSQTDQPPETGIPDPDPGASITSADLKAIMTPPGARVVYDADGMLELRSADSVDKLAAFYEDAVKKVGAKTTQSFNVGMAWSYYGTYDDGKTLMITLGNTGRERTIVVYWDFDTYRDR